MVRIVGKLLFLPPPPSRADPGGLAVVVFAAVVALLSMGTLLVVGRPGVPEAPAVTAP